MTRRRQLSAAACVFGAVVLSGCVTPATNDATYEHKVELSAQAAASGVASARLAVTTWLDHRIAGTYLEVVVVDAESAVGAVSDTFVSIEAPQTSDSASLRARTSKALAAAEDALTELRIAVRHSDRPAVARQQQQLTAVAHDLETLATQADRAS